MVLKSIKSIIQDALTIFRQKLLSDTPVQNDSKHALSLAGAYNIENRIGKNNFGEAIYITDYTNRDTPYTFPCDGYLLLTRYSSISLDVYIFSADKSHAFTIRHSLNIDGLPLFVRKGMHMWNNTSGSQSNYNIKFYPFW